MWRRVLREATVRQPWSMISSKRCLSSSPTSKPAAVDNLLLRYLKEHYVEVSKMNPPPDQDKCTDSGLKTLENRKKPIFLKQFKTLSALSWCKELDTCLNTLLIDNDPYKALLNPPHTAIFPDEYTVDCAGDSALGPEGDLRVYLEGLADAEDVPSYVKDHPFGKPAITPLHPDWGFYSKIVRRLSKESIEN